MEIIIDKSSLALLFNFRARINLKATHVLAIQHTDCDLRPYVNVVEFVKSTIQARTVLRRYLIIINSPTA